MSYESARKAAKKAKEKGRGAPKHRGLYVINDDNYSIFDPKDGRFGYFGPNIEDVIKHEKMCRHSVDRDWAYIGPVPRVAAGEKRLLLCPAS
jgi:hypothetical protein